MVFSNNGTRMSICCSRFNLAQRSAFEWTKICCTWSISLYCKHNNAPLSHLTIQCIRNASPTFASRRVKELPTFVISGRSRKEASSATLTDGFVYLLLYSRMNHLVSVYLLHSRYTYTLKWNGLRIVHCTRCISACRFWFWISSVSCLIKWWFVRRW